MIVKDESVVIERCLNSVKLFVDYWVIVDTGSTDGTQEIIRKCMKDIPGKLYERPWENFEHNRNEALDLAKGKAEYILIMDADEELKMPLNGEFPELTLDAYLVKVSGGNYDTPKIFLFKSKLPWRWKGVIHEMLLCENPKPVGAFLNGLEIFGDTLDGCRSRDPLKYAKDAAILEKALKKEPENSRYWIFLGESYYLIEKYAEAMKAYEKRVALGGWEEEVYHALYKIGACKHRLGRSVEEVIEAYSKAYAYRPSRGEPLYRIAACQQLKNPKLAYETIKRFVALEIPTREIQVEFPLYHYLGEALLAECAASIGKKDEAKSVAAKLLQRGDLPLDVKKRMEPLAKY